MNATVTSTRKTSRQAGSGFTDVAPPQPLPRRAGRLLTGAIATGVLTLVVAGAMATAPPTASAATVQTVATTPARVRRLASDGRHVAWMQEQATCAREVRVVDRVTRTVTEVGGGCQDTWGTLARAYSSEVQLAIAGTTPTWSVIAGGGAIATDVYIREADLASAGVVSPLNSFNHPNTGDTGMWLTGIAGRGVVRAYGIRNWQRPDPYTWIFGGSVHTVIGGLQATLPGGTDPLFMAIASGRVFTAMGAPGAHVISGDPVDGSPGFGFNPGGRPLALAARGGIVAVLVQRADGTRQLRTFSATTGTMLAHRTVANSVRPSISTGHGTVAFRTGRAIKLMNAYTGSARRLVATDGYVAGPLVEGCKVLWAESFPGAGYIRSTRAC